MTGEAGKAPNYWPLLDFLRENVPARRGSRGEREGPMTSTGKQFLQ